MIRLLLWLPLAFVLASWLALVITGRRRPQPPVLVPAVLHDCGCLRIAGGLLLPCPAHDPAEPPVEQWAAELEDQ